MKLTLLSLNVRFASVQIILLIMLLFATTRHAVGANKVGEKAGPLVWKAISLSNNGQYDEAIAAAEEASRYNPVVAWRIDDCRIAKANHLLRTGKLTEAEALFRIAITNLSVMPKTSMPLIEGLKGYATLLDRQGKKKEAERIRNHDIPKAQEAHRKLKMFSTTPPNIMFAFEKDPHYDLWLELHKADQLQYVAGDLKQAEISYQKVIKSLSTLSEQRYKEWKQRAEKSYKELLMRKSELNARDASKEGAK